MKYVILLCALALMIFSCSPTQEIKNVTKTRCLIAMDTLAASINKSHHGLYAIDLEKFNATHLDNMTDRELTLQGLPLKKVEQKKYLFLEYMKRLRIQTKSFADCSRDEIEKVLGLPTNVYIKNELGGNNISEYLLNSGFECPNCNNTFERLFESCDYIRFYFNEDKLTDVTFEIFYTGL